jgi:iron(III) transport system ATP-binding protein
MTDPDAHYLRIQGLNKYFGHFQALKDIQLDVHEGELICFLGPSGCGKTTLLRAIAGLDLQTSGSIQQAGVDISTLPVTERDFGIVFQSYALFPNLTAAKNISFGLENIGHTRDQIDARVAELLKLVGLPDQGDKFPSQLSGGQQQRIALARAIATSPGLLLLDEPLSALDARVRVLLRHELKELQRKLGVTTVMVTHDQEEALVLADRIVVMNHGVIEQVGTPADIYCNPTSLFVAEFIGEMNQLQATSNKPGQLQVGTLNLHSDAGHWPDQPIGSALVAAIRPEDIIPLTTPPDTGNHLNVSIRDMAFMGSFWRSHLHDDCLGDNDLIADFSINAVRRLSLQIGNRLTVELPADRLLAFER